jgi:hypothetical protein
MSNNKSVEPQSCEVRKETKVFFRVADARFKITEWNFKFAL